MNDRTLRMIIRDENGKSNNSLKKDLKLMFMTKGECLAQHQGRHSAEAVTNGNLKKEQIKFWSKLTGLITLVTTLIGIFIAYMSSKLGGG